MMQKSCSCILTETSKLFQQPQTSMAITVLPLQKTSYGKSKLTAKLVDKFREDVANGKIKL